MLPTPSQVEPPAFSNPGIALSLLHPVYSPLPPPLLQSHWFSSLGRALLTFSISGTTYLHLRHNSSLSRSWAWLLTFSTSGTTPHHVHFRHSSPQSPYQTPPAPGPLQAHLTVSSPFTVPQPLPPQAHLCPSSSCSFSFGSRWLSSLPQLWLFFKPQGMSLFSATSLLPEVLLRWKFWSLSTILTAEKAPELHASVQFKRWFPGDFWKLLLPYLWSSSLPQYSPSPWDYVWSNG